MLVMRMIGSCDADLEDKIPKAGIMPAESIPMVIFMDIPLENEKRETCIGKWWC
jgi:hypothetical protein